MSAAMNKTVPWSVKGVGFDAREIAHKAARREGVPVGQWLNGVIRDQANALGVAADDFTQEERLDALVARLAGVAESVKAEEESGQIRTASVKRVASSGTAGAHPMSHSWADDDYAGSRDGRSRPVRRSAEAPDAQVNTRHWDDEILLDQAMELVGRRTTAAEERAQGEKQRLRIAALAKEVERLNRAEADAIADRRRSRGGTSQPAARPPRASAQSEAPSPAYADMASAGRSLRAPAGPLRNDSGERLGPAPHRGVDAAAEPPRTEATFRDFDEKLRQIATRFEPRPAGSAGSPGRGEPGDAGEARFGAKRTQTGRRDAISDITERQADLDAFEQRRAALLKGTSFDSMEPSRRLVADRVGGGAGGPDPFGNLNDAFAKLTERLEARIDDAARKRTDAARQPDGEIVALKTGIAALGTRLDAMKDQIGQGHTASAERESLDALRNEIAALQVGLTKLAPQSAITTLESAVRDLGGQIDESRRDGVSDAVLQPLERLRTEVQKAVEAREVRGTLGRIEEQLGSLAQRAESAGENEPASAALTDLQADTVEIRKLLEGAAGQFQAVERLEVQLGQLSGRVERLTESPPRSAVRDLELATNEIRTMLVELAPEDALQALSRKLDGLAERFGVLEQQIASPIAMFDDFARRMDDAHSALADRLLRAAPVVDLAPIEDMIDGLSGKIDGLRYPVADMQALGGLIRGLTAQIDEARLPNADSKILDGLEEQVGRLAERLDRSDANLDAIASVERLVRDLFGQLDDTRTATVDAAEKAARIAAQETLKVAQPAGAAGDEASAAQATRALEQVGQELSEFRKVQQLSEKRVHATLLALNETLEKMVEATLAGARRAKPVPAATDAPDAVAAAAEPPVQSATPVAAPVAEPVASDAKAVEIKRPAVAAKPVAPAIDIGRAAALAEPMPDVTPLIAAARRAAQAAQTSVSDMGRKADIWDAAPKAAEQPKSAKGWGAFFKQKRRPMLLSVASVVLLLGALEIARVRFPSQTTDAVATVDTTTDDTPVGKTAEATPTPKSDSNGDNKTVAAMPASTAPQAAPAAPQVTASIVNPSPSSLGVDKKTTATTSFVPVDSAPKALAPSLRDLAEHGDAAAEAEIGARLADGRGVTRDSKAAANWFERAAKQGYAPAEYRLGSAYEKGNGVTADPVQAVGWYEKAATQGNVRAMHNLAVMAAEGSGGKADYARAASWFTKAAEHGVRDSQYNLAILYARGLGLAKDLSQSYTWFSIATAQGDADAAKKRDDVAAKLDANQIAAAKAAAAAFKPTAVEKAANDIVAPPGGWDVASPATGTGSAPKVSSM